ncbi:hypothetical protein MTR55_07275, partial [Escherichia coli]|nr:hypothetical protein [Escherichia coli]
RPLTDFGGKTSIFSHPVYLFLREFSLQDFRGGSTVQAIQWLTRAPDRFSAAQFSPLLEHEKSSTQIINLLVWSGLCGWINRLKIALGETY